MRKTLCFLILSAFFAVSTKAQDKIVKINGDTINAKVLEVGTNGVSYKKASMPDGPTFTELKSNILFIRFSDGKIEYCTQKAPGSAGTNSTSSATVAPSSGKTRIESSDGQYTINGQKASLKQVSRQLSTSNNPAITLPLKAAKTANVFQKIVKIVSIPTTLGGSATTLVTGINLINDIRRGRDHTSSYLGAFGSLLGTVSLPITNKILKKKTAKMYDKLIDIYNVTN
jgi:hypothetical protein